MLNLPSYTSNSNMIFCLRWYPILVICLLFLPSCQSTPAAEHIELPALFSDHMVLQQDAVITIWGKASPQKQVTALFKNQRSSAIAQEDSTWHLYLAPEQAGGPFELHIIGTDTLLIKDVLIGEVWIGSGQSNMQWSVSQSADAEKELQDANYPNIRLFSVDRTASTTPEYKIPTDGWKPTNPSSIASFSAVSYYFGRTLHDSLNVPIGLIHSSWGGTPAEAWTSAQSLLALPDFEPAVRQLQESTVSFESLNTQYNKELDHWYITTLPQSPGYRDQLPFWGTPEANHDEWATMNIPSLWEEEGLPGFDGVVWLNKIIDLPSEWTHHDAILTLGQVDDADITWLNGTEIGRSYRYDSRRQYQIPKEALKTGPNSISVRVLDTGGGGGIYGAKHELTLESANSELESIPLSGPWKYKKAMELANFTPPPPRPSPIQHTPSVLYNAMIHPLIPFRVKGVIWYQGESNASRAFQYRSLFNTLINDWRLQWNDPIAFHFVQLANFQALQKKPVEQETWPELREAQTMALQLPNTGMAVTIDIGEADDIHPRNKQDVGYRLALNALNKSYKLPIVPAGPLYKSMEIFGDSILIEFDYSENGLMTSNDEEVLGFAIAGNDQEFQWAQAMIRGSKVVVHSPRVPSPVAVRYGWANNPVTNLQNKEGLPASPFRTDDWPGVTENSR